MKVLRQKRRFSMFAAAILNEGVAKSSYAPPTHTVMVPQQPHGLCGEKSFSFSPLLRSLAHTC